MEQEELEFKLKRLGLGYVINPRFQTAVDFYTGDLCAKLVGELYARDIGFKVVEFGPPTFLEFLFRRKRKITVTVQDVLLDPPPVAEGIRRQLIVHL